MSYSSAYCYLCGKDRLGNTMGAVTVPSGLFCDECRALWMELKKEHGEDYIKGFSLRGGT